MERRLSELLPVQEKQIRFYADILEKVYILNFDTLHMLIQDRRLKRVDRHTISRRFSGLPAAGRALVVMCHYKESITRFVKRLKTHPILAIVCGFEPDSVPGVGTFYNFLTDSGWEKNLPK